MGMKKRPSKERGPVVPLGSVLILEVRTSTEDGKELARSLSDYLQARISQLPGRNVMSSFEVQRLLDLEIEKQGAGCENDSCMAEIADALDADGVIFSRLTRLGQQWVLSVTFYDARARRATSRILVRAKKEEKLLSRLEQHLSVAFGEKRARKTSAKLPWLTIAGTGSLGLGLAVGALSGAVLGGWIFGQKSLSPSLRGQLEPLFPALPIAGAVTSSVFLVGGGALFAVDVLSE